MRRFEVQEGWTTRGSTCWFVQMYVDDRACGADHQRLTRSAAENAKLVYEHGWAEHGASESKITKALRKHGLSA